MTTTLTLWRGEQRLGRLLQRAQHGVVQRPDRPALSAFVVLSEGAPRPESVWQVLPFFGMGVQQDPMEPLVHGEPDPEVGKYPSSGALEPAPPEKIAGVPREVQLTIRNDEGRVWLPRQVWLREIRFRPEDIERARRETPAEALVDGSVWLAFVGFDSDTGSPTPNEHPSTESA